MVSKRPIWLVNNSSSGSNDEEALASLEQACGEHGFHVAHRTIFPAQDLPTPAILDAAGINRVAVFAGDGTINSLLAILCGWSGAVLVLPGGTMNLLYHRLHGEQEMDEVIAAAATGDTQLCRPGIIKSAYGDAYAGLMAGPGTSWNRVREAMRKTAIAEMAENTVAAIQETLGGEQIVCAEPRFGRPDGYPLLMMNPTEDAIELAAFYAETPGEYLEQAWALLKRNFREGPHEILGSAQRLRIASTQGNPFGLLIDGEPAEAAAVAELTFSQCEVDLVATQPNAL